MKLRSITKIHGGKSYVKDFIIGNLPAHDTYVECCFGAGSVFLNKKKSRREVINDIDKSIYNLVYHLKNHSKEFINKLKDVVYSEEVFLSATKKEGIDGAINELIVRRMSRGGLKKNFSWSNRLRGGQPGEVNSWQTYKEQLPLICERLKDAEITNKNVFDLVPELDGKDVVFYVDPPYLKSTRTVKSVYEYEMTDEDHIRLNQLLKSCVAKVMISGYSSPLYNDLYKGWRMEMKEVPNHSGQSKKKQRRVECVWCNY